MEQNKFKELIEAPCEVADDMVEMITIRGAIRRVVRLTLQYPEDAKRYYDSLPKIVNDNIPTPSESK